MYCVEVIRQIMLMDGLAIFYYGVHGVDYFIPLIVITDIDVTHNQALFRCLAISVCLYVALLSRKS